MANGVRFNGPVAYCIVVKVRGGELDGVAGSIHGRRALVGPPTAAACGLFASPLDHCYPPVLSGGEDALECLFPCHGAAADGKLHGFQGFWAYARRLIPPPLNRRRQRQTT